MICRKNQDLDVGFPGLGCVISGPMMRVFWDDDVKKLLGPDCAKEVA